MKNSTRIFFWLLIAMTFLFAHNTLQAQSVLNPSDTVATFNPADTPAIPAYGSIAKWVRTVRMSWNTSNWKSYIYNGNQFRLRFPPDYNPTANDGKVYPMLIFMHGDGEGGSVYDNEYSLYHGGNVFETAVSNGTFDGYVLVMQTQGGWGANQMIAQRYIVDYMIQNNKLDPFRIYLNGLSAGGSGDWQFYQGAPTYPAALIPMSSVNIAFDSPDTVSKYKFTPIWCITGGLDGSPAPYTAQQVANAMAAQGANYTWLDMTTQGHDTWDSTWSMKTFWPWLKAQYASNPWCLFGRTQFCPGDSINVTVGLVAGYQAYQWRKNGVVIPGATSNTINVTSVGTYDARVERNGNWSSWSPTPVVIAIKAPTVTPPITVSGLMSDVLPATDGRNYVTLTVPDSNYTSFTWKKVGSDSVIGTQGILKVTQPGQYIVSVTQQYGCSSNFSPPFRVVGASGPNPPSAATNLVASALSYTQVQLMWARNPHPANPETGFEVYRATTITGPYTFAGLVPADTVDFMDNGLKPNTQYYYVVRAVDSTGAAPLSNQVTVITQSDKTPPTGPASLRVLTTSSTSVTLIWNGSTDNVAVTGYYIYVNGAKSYATAAGDTSFVVSDLTPGQQYSFFVVAVDGSGNASVHSNQVSGAAVNTGLNYSYYNLSATPAVMPNFATLTPAFSGNMPNVSIANATATTNFAYEWNGYIHIPAAGNYIFETVSDDGSQVWLGSLNGTSFPYNYSGGSTLIVNANKQQGATATKSATLSLQAGVYPISIAYFQGGGGYSMALNWSTPSSNGSFVAVPASAFAGTFTPAGTPPARPTGVTATATAYNKVSVGWTDNSTDETGFEVYRATSSGGALTIVGTTGPNVTSFIDSTVSGSSTYFYQVDAVNTYGGSGFDSASISGVTYNYYQGTFTNLAGLSAMTPATTGRLNNFSLSPSTTTTNFAFKYMGFITIPTTGSYTFYTTSDDGSDLYIGGYDSSHLVVKNDFAQGATQRSGTVSLTQGRYPIYVTYYQGGGGYSLTAAYKGPGINQQNIPDSVLYCKASMAKTPALPAIPGAPYGVAATALSPSKVGISWADSSATVTGYQLYRSIGDTVHFIAFAGVPAGNTAFADTALFSNTTYYYKVVASGVAGNSGYSVMVSANTPDVLPVITKLPAGEQARYGTTTVFNVSATSVNSGALTFKAYNLPPFATFTDNGNATGTLTVTPAAANAGSYTGLYIVVSDTYGGTDTTKFNLAVNNNYAPVIAPVSAITMNEGDTLTVALSGSNPNPADTLSFAVAGAPGNSVLTNVSNGSATLFLHPSYAAAGTYTVIATLNDNNGLSAADTFTVKVNYKSPITKIFTRVVYNDANALGLPWNGLLGTSTSNLVDSNGNVTPLGLQFSPSSWWTPYNGGSSTGNNSGVYPDEVLQNYMWFGSYYGGPNTFNGTVTGADTASLYDLTFYANSTYNGIPNNGYTTFTAGGQTLSLYVQNNQHNTVTVANLKPAADGTIPFTLGLGPNTLLGYFSALVITKHFVDGTAPAGISGLTATDVPSQVQLSWTDSAYNATGYEVWRALTATGSYSLLGNVSGNSANSYVDSTVAGSTGYTYKVRAVNANGSSSFDSVSTVTAHRLPKITAISNVIMKDTSTVTVNVTTTDDSTAQLTLTAANLPPFATFTDNGNGTGVLTIAPSAGTVGMYSNVSITAADADDSTASTSFSIAVTEPNVQSVYLNFAGNGVAAPAPWNSMTTPPFQGTVLSNLTDDTGTPTGISATLLDGWYWYGVTGYVTGNSDGVYPPGVIQNFYYDPSSNTRRIQISGLNNARQYNFVFFNSQWDGTNGLTTFKINGDSVQLQPDWNISKTVQLNGITPVNGVVTIGVTKASGAANSYLNSIVIEGYDTTAGTLLSPADLRALAKTQTTISLQWQDRSAIETGYEVWKASDSTGSYSLLASLPANTTTYRDTKLTRGTNYYYIVRAVNNGTYSNYSNVLAVTTYGDAIYIHPSTSAAGNGPTPPWNNLNSPGGTGTSWSGFIDSTGALTSVGMVQTGEFAGANALGDVTGNNSGVYPDPVLLQQYVLFPGNYGSFTISGLNLSKVYDFTFFGSENYQGGNNNTGYVVNGDTVYLNAFDNTNATVTLHGVVPSSLGQANVMMYCPGTSVAGWFNAMVINGYTPLAQNSPTVPGVTGGSNATVNTAVGNQFTAAAATTPAVDSVIQAYPNPFHSSFTLSVPVFNTGEKVVVALFDVNGRLVYRKEFDNVFAGVNYLSIGGDANIGAPGVYIGKVIFSSGRAAQSFKLLKD